MMTVVVAEALLAGENDLMMAPQTTHNNYSCVIPSTGCETINTAPLDEK